MSKKPMAVFTVRPSEREGQKDFWTQVGTMFPHPHGEGFNILLNANPIDGKLVVLPKREERDAHE